jgi:hypothetical protein
VPGARLLAVGGGVFTLLVSLIYTLTVTRHLSTQDLALVTVINAALGVAFAFMGYVTTWYPRVLAQEPHRYNELVATELLTSTVAWGIYAAYLATISVYDPALYLLGYLIILLNSWPAGAYLSIYRQRLSATLTYVSQTLKLAGAYMIRSNPTIYLVLLVNILMAIPTFLSKVAKPNFGGVIHFLKTALRGGPFQTLILLNSLVNALVIYAIQLAGGGPLLAYYYILFQITKSVYPSWILTSLMYGSLLKEEDKVRRSLLDGAVIISIHLLAAAIMLKTPQWFIALLRPTEINNQPLIEAVAYNSLALILGSYSLHINTVILGVEKNIVITLKDKPAKALIYDLATSPLIITLMYYTSASLSAKGMVLTFALWSALSTVYRLKLLGSQYRPLATQLYLPTLAAFLAIYLTPLPTIPYNTENIITTITTYMPNALLIGATSYLYLYALSPPTRTITKILINKIIPQRDTTH